MLSNLHTHTTFCDGNDTSEAVVLSAIEKGFASIGFSGHAYTGFDLRYCMKNTEAYISEINSLKEKYRGKIQVYLGTEEDAFHPVERSKYDYIIGSSHYFLKDGVYYPIDSSHEHFKRCLDAFEHNLAQMAENYYSTFCEYILKRKPDIIGHFDLITKYEEVGEPYFYSLKEYNAIAEKYARVALASGSIFEVNTGAISRGLRTRPYPSESILRTILKEGGRITLSSDSHSKDTIDCFFKESRQMLKDIGFKTAWFLNNGNFEEMPL